MYFSTPKESAYFKRKEKLLEKWDEARPKLVKASVEKSCLPNEIRCNNCEWEYAVIRCRDCSFTSYYCKECAEILHSKKILFHSMEVWEVCTDIRILIYVVYEWSEEML